MWRIFEELKEVAPDGANAHLAVFEKNREEVQAAMSLTVSTGSDLIGNLSDKFFFRKGFGSVLLIKGLTLKNSIFILPFIFHLKLSKMHKKVMKSE